MNRTLRATLALFFTLLLPARGHQRLPTRHRHRAPRQRTHVAGSSAPQAPDPADHTTAR